MSAARKPNTAGSLPAAVVDRPGRSRGPWVARLDSARPGVNALIDQRQRLEREFRATVEHMILEVESLEAQLEVDGLRMVPANGD